MAGAPFARKRLIPEGNPNNKNHQPYRDTAARLFILHSQVGGSNLHDYFGRSGIVVESHYQVWKNGVVDLLVDTSLTADANYKANPRAISVETEDNGNPDRDRWTDEQCMTLAMLLVYHDIPLRTAKGPYDNGVGYHSQFDEWTVAEGIGKTCPGNVRIKQIPYIIKLAEQVKEGIVSWAEKVVDSQSDGAKDGTKVTVPTALEILWRAAKAQNKSDDALHEKVDRLTAMVSKISAPNVSVTQEQLNAAVLNALNNVSFNIDVN